MSADSGSHSFSGYAVSLRGCVPAPADCGPSVDFRPIEAAARS